ncbi:MAG: hypothetical protein JSV27_06975 [Candidatus Bathyarchaeota archaeon]|nr:MAG: hypothetical protein JSV27_06975 [Candidatus Bathyarchaeota archaeon]
MEDARFCAKCGAPLGRVSEDESLDSIENIIESTIEGISSTALPGILIGVFIIVIGLTFSSGQDVGRIVGNWGETFGEGMGSWGESFGSSMGSWGENMGRFFADFGRNLSISFGASMVIVVGLVIVAWSLFRQDVR